MFDVGTPLTGLGACVLYSNVGAGSAMRAAVVVPSQEAGANRCSARPVVEGAGWIYIACAPACVLIDGIKPADVGASDVLTAQAGVVARSARTCIMRSVHHSTSNSCPMYYGTVRQVSWL